MGFLLLDYVDHVRLAAGIEMCELAQDEIRFERGPLAICAARELGEG